ncbi:MAG: hypothetical protein ABFS18_01955 [Thermodesulfobacteriota bacterium]
MKTISSILLAIFLLASLQACGGPVEGGTTTGDTTGATAGDTTGDTTTCGASENIVICDFSGNVADRFASTTIELNNTPDDISNLIVRFEYDPAVVERYTVLADDQFMSSYGFDLKTLNLSGSGWSAIELEFYTLDSTIYLPQGSSGVLATVTFEVLQDSNTTLPFVQTAFDDDHPDWTKKDGVFTVSK